MGRFAGEQDTCITSDLGVDGVVHLAGAVVRPTALKPPLFLSVITVQEPQVSRLFFGEHSQREATDGGQHSIDLMHVPLGIDKHNLHGGIDVGVAVEEEGAVLERQYASLGS
jgi:hypothetical protein